MSTKETTYFDRPDPVNTEKTLDIGIERALNLDLDFLVVPSITGRTALKASKKVKALPAEEKPSVVCVTFRAGGAWKVGKEISALHWEEIPELKERWEEWREKGIKKVTFNEELKKELGNLGIPIVRATDIGSSVESSMTKNLGVGTHKKILKESLYLLSPGIKVSVFSTLMAADAGKIPTSREVISFGGTEQGVDSAAVIKPSYSDTIFSPKNGLEIREILCKPRSMKGKSGKYYGRGWNE